ncbi:hypothetical protein M9Y10_000762 [Tritrichomonas musculus]|uniref:BEACH domain-containing protein n=1 Tax=Tritrichomonas musculus TaxID=1915356 RepID=A0ABR2L5Z8_9EUKA
MFSFFQTNPEQTQRICDAVIKTYATPIQSPKNFYQNNPKLKSFSELLEPSAYKQKQLQEIVKDKYSRPFELELILGTELDLNQSIPDNWFDIFTIYQSEPNNDSSGKEFIFQFALRILIKANYQLKYFVNIFNSNPTLNSDPVLTYIPKLLTFFIENSDFMNQTFFDVLSSLYGHVNYRWRSIFYNNSYVLRKFAASIFLSASRIVPYESHNVTNFSFSFIKDVFSQSYRYFTDFCLRPQLLVEFQRSLIYIVEKSSKEQKAIICQMICNLLQEAPTFLTDFSNALLNLKNCVHIYKECLNGLQSDNIISTFQIVLEYVVWVIMKFPESSVLVNNSDFRFPKVSFSAIDTSSYMKKTVVLPQKVKSALSPKFDCVPTILSEIIETNEETKAAILKDIRDYLVKCQPTISWDRFSDQIFRARRDDEDDNDGDLNAEVDTSSDSESTSEEQVDDENLEGVSSGNNEKSKEERVRHRHKHIHRSHSKDKSKSKDKDKDRGKDKHKEKEKQREKEKEKEREKQREIETEKPKEVTRDRRNSVVSKSNNDDFDESDYWSPVKDIQSSDDSETPSEYIHFRALLCFFIEVTKKLNDRTIFSFYFKDFEAFMKDWAPLFLTYIYPTHSFLIGHLFFKCYKSIISERKALLNEISYLIDSRIQQNHEVSLLVFLPLINSLFLDLSDFGSSFVSSQLLKSLIRESKKNNRVFLLLSSIIYKYPIECFTSSPLTNFITDSFDDPAFHKTFVRCLINGLKYCGQKKDSTEIRLLLNHLTALLPTLLAKKYQKSYDLIDIMAKTIPSFDSDNLDLFFKVRILDLIADSCRNDPSENMFRSAFQFFIALSRTSNQNLLRMSNPKSSIFSTLIEIFEKNHFDFDIVDILFDFAIIPYQIMSLEYFKNKDSVINQTFLNPMAITLIFKWIEGRDNESEVVHQIYLMSNMHVVNAFQLQKANIPTLILARISKINNETELVSRYFDLLYNIWRQGCPISDAYSAISTMKVIRFPHLIIDTFSRLLRQEKKEHSIFYWMNGINSGFSGTKITFDKSIDTLFISFQCFIDEISNQDKTLVFIQNDKGDTIEFGINQNNIYFEYNGGNKVNFKSTILVNIWHHITFIVNSKKIRMIIYEKAQEQIKVKTIRKKSLRFSNKDKKQQQEETPIPENMYDNEVFTCPSFFNQSINLFIGRRNDSNKFFSGLIGTIFVFNDLISYNLYSQLSKLVLFNYTIPHLLAIYVPRIVEDSDIIHISNDLTAEFHGLTLTSYQTIHSVITNTKVLDCFLPFYNKIISCKSCKGTEEYCTKCGRLDKDKGRKLLVSLTSIIARLLQFNSSNLINKAPKSIIELLSQYFIKIDTIFFSDDFINTFLSLFEIAQTPNLDIEAEIGTKMVEEIWLNYEMISKFPPDMQLRYFSMNLVKLFQQDSEGYKLFNSFTSYDFLIHKLLLFFTNSDENVAKIAWQITLECILKNSIATATATALLGLSFSPETAPVSEPIVNFIDFLEKTSNTHMISAIQIFNSLLPFAIWASRPPLQSQRKALNYIIGQNNYSSDEIKTALMQVAFLYEPPTPKNSLFQIVLRHFQNGCLAAYPLLIRVISNLDKADLESNTGSILTIISPEKYSKLALFPYWVLSLTEVFVKNEITMLDFSQVFGKYITLQFNEKRFESLEKLRCLILLYSAEKSIDLSSLFDRILEYLFEYYRKNNEKSSEILGVIFGNFFIHLFFKSEINLNDPEDNFLSKYSDHFCTFSHKPQISFEFVNKFQSAIKLNVLNDFLSFLPKKNFEIRLSDNFMMESSQLIAYTLLKLCESGAKLDSTVKDFVKSSKGNQNALTIIRNYSCSATAKLKGDDPKQFLSAFELSFSMITLQLKHSIQNQFSMVTKEILGHILKTMNISNESKPPFQGAHPLLYFLQAIESTSSQKLLNMYKKYRQSTTVKFNNKKIANARKLTVFLRELYILCGPWFDFTHQNKLHFKIANSFCYDGSRALMRVDNKHDFSKQIASIEDIIKPVTQDMNNNLIPSKLLTIKATYTGNIQLFPDSLVFNGEFQHIQKRKIRIFFNDLLFVFQRMLPNGIIGIEVFVSGIKSYLFETSQQSREHILTYIETYATSTNYVNYIYTDKYNFFNELVKSTGKKVQRLGSNDLYKTSGLFEAWDSHKISTYSYLFYLNIISGRSFNCLLIYPVFPWVISDYKSDKIDIGNPHIYRDFTKPTCLLNDKQQRYYKTTVENGDKNFKGEHQSPHFSNPYIVSGFLKRVEPFGTIDAILNNQNNHRKPKSFDSLADTWDSVSNDVFDNRELTPEFFSNEFIFKESYAPCRNQNVSAYTSTSNLTQSISQIDNSYSCFQINYQQQNISAAVSPISKEKGEINEEEDFVAISAHSEKDNETGPQIDLSETTTAATNKENDKSKLIQRVLLPPWAKGKTSIFLKVNCAALESEFTRRSIHHWIDLMFGVKSPLWFDKADWNIININTKPPEFVKKINRNNVNSWYSSDGSLAACSELVIQIYPRFCYGPYTKESGGYGICPRRVINDPVPDSKMYVPKRVKKISIAASQVFRMRKSFVMQSDFTVFNYFNGITTKTQPIQNMKFFEVSNEMNTVFFASPFELYVKAIIFNNKTNNSLNESSGKVRRKSSMSKNSTDSLNSSNSVDINDCSEISEMNEMIINHEAAPISSIAVIKNILVTATTDGTIRRWLLPHFVVCQKNNLHYCNVIALGGCLSLNLLVSMDAFANVVFESLMSNPFSLCTKLKRVYKSNFIHVFKSGKVAIIQSDPEESCVTLLNMKGRVVNEKKYNFCIQEFDAVSNSTFVENLLIGYNSDTVDLVDIPSLRTTASYHGLIPNMKFCRAKDSKEFFYAFTGTKIELLPLSKI